MKKSLKLFFRYFAFVVVTALWAGVFFNFAEFADSPVTGMKDRFVIFMQWGTIVFVSFVLIYILAINKYIFLVFLVPYTLLGAVIAYSRLAFKATLTPMLIDAALHNDAGTTSDLISSELIFFIILSLAICIGIIFYRFRKIEIDKKWLHFTVSFIFFFLLLNVSPRFRSSIFQRFPLSVYHNIAQYNKLKVTIAENRINPDPNVYNSEFDSIDVVLILGESLRAANMQLNGYYRKTNPYLSVRQNVYSFPYIFSEYTHTNRSLPHILTRADSANTERAFQEKSLISLFTQCGFKSAWISNQDPAPTYVSFINECDTVVYVHPEMSVYNYNNWVDEDILPHLRKTIPENYNKRLFLLHTIGSHWYYNNHYSDRFEVFKPVTKSRIISQNSPEQIINSYDNTVLYTDFFINEVIKMFESRNAIIVFLSDHGEVLGEDGMWLHASDHIALKNPAMFVWFSDSYASKNGEKKNAMVKNLKKHYRTDFFFHSVLSAAGINSETISDDLNIFSFD